MLHQLIKYWFEIVESGGYWGVFILMALESSIVPVPSEIVMPPAAYWASQGKLNFNLVVLAGTLGSYFGSAVSYWGAHWLGRPLLHKYGKYILIPEDKLIMAENLVRKYGVPGVFISRLLPVIRHLISMPAGVFRMPFFKFSVVTTLGAGIWCYILAWFGQVTLGNSPQLLDSPEEMIFVMKSKLSWFVLFVAILALLYAGLLFFQKKFLAKRKV
ncbi:MAG: DedA family protein [Pseudomonadota bacterium]|nr:DedA family protein [Pseudomonadota bacterium]